MYAPPAGPAPGLRYCGFWIRFAAYLIDTVILWVPLGVLLAFTLGSVLPDLHCTLVYGPDGRTVQNVHCGNLAALNGLWAFDGVSIAVPALYFIVLWGWLGRSLGQMLLGMHIVDAATGARISMARAILRYVMFFVSSIPFALGLMWAGWDPRKQGWHDMAAGTFVVRRI
jgi:uncharacterized RDD family membrane protein YckC